MRSQLALSSRFANTPLVSPKVCYIPLARSRNTCIQRKEISAAVPTTLTNVSGKIPRPCRRRLVPRLTHRRPRITISINATGEQLDQELLTLDLSAALTVAELKSFVEAETNFPAATQHFYLDGRALQSDTQTLEQAGIKDGEMLALMVNRRSAQGAQLRQMQERRQVDRSEPGAAQIEATRNRILQDPAAMTQLIHQQPDLARVINDPERFKEAWMAARAAQDNAQRVHENNLALLNQDPFNADAQRQIEEMIRRERIEQNRQYAYENNPAGMLCASLWPGSLHLC